MGGGGVHSPSALLLEARVAYDAGLSHRLGLSLALPDNCALTVFRYAFPLLTFTTAWRRGSSLSVGAASGGARGLRRRSLASPRALPRPTRQLRPHRLRYAFPFSHSPLLGGGGVHSPSALLLEARVAYDAGLSHRLEALPRPTRQLRPHRLRYAFPFSHSPLLGGGGVHSPSALLLEARVAYDAGPLASPRALPRPTRQLRPHRLRYAFPFLTFTTAWRRREVL